MNGISRNTIRLSGAGGEEKGGFIFECNLGNMCGALVVSTWGLAGWLVWGEVGMRGAGVGSCVGCSD